MENAVETKREESGEQLRARVQQALRLTQAVRDALPEQSALPREVPLGFAIMVEGLLIDALGQ